MTGGPTPPGGFDFEQIRRILESLGLGGEFDQSEIARMMQQMNTMNPGMMFGMTPADQDPDAAWRTTITAAKAIVQGTSPDPAPAATERGTVVDAERLAQNWLSAQTTFPEPGTEPLVLTRAEWLDQTSDGWRRLVEPIIDGLADALRRGAGDDAPQEIGALAAALEPLMRSSASLIYRDRLKRVLADLATSTLTGTELGIDLLPQPRVSLVPTNVAHFTEDLELPDRDVVFYLLLLEAARVRLFRNVGWLSPQLTALLAHFAREIRIDFDAISSQFEGPEGEELSIENVMAVGEQLKGSFFQPASTPEQLEVLARLEHLLALIEGWASHVANRAAAIWLPNGAQLSEVVRRRRASTNATQGVFADLLGLELRPKSVREAENLWAAIEHSRGLEGRDTVWSHPDLLPTPEHLADPLGFESAATDDPAEDDLDAELRKLLGES